MRCPAVYHQAVPVNLVARSLSEEASLEPEFVQEQVRTYRCSNETGHGGPHMVDPPSGALLRNYIGLPEGWVVSPDVAMQIADWETRGRPKLETSAAVDTWLYIGVAAQAIGRILSQREDLQVIMRGGRFFLSYVGGEPLNIAGTAGLEPMVVDWERAQRMLGDMGREPHA